MNDDTKQLEYPPLTTLYAYLTEGCNLACRHCWLRPKYDPQAKRYPVLSAELLARVLDEARPLGLETVKLTGGEPLMHPEIRRILDDIRERELELLVETNGIVCTPEIAAAIAGCEVNTVSVSIDGATADIHEDVRGVEGSFEKALDGIRNLVAVGLKPQLIFSVMRQNVHQLEDILRMAEELGVSSLKYNVIQPTARGKDMYTSDAAVTVSELIDLAAQVELKLSRRTDIRLLFDVPPAFRPLSRIADGNCGSCGIMGIIGLIPTGHYALCGIGEQIPELTFGLAGQVPLAEIWTKHPLLQKLRRELPQELQGICAECLMKQFCMGSCVAQNYYRTGDLTAPFWFCEEAENAGLFPDSRRGAEK